MTTELTEKQLPYMKWALMLLAIIAVITIVLLPYFPQLSISDGANGPVIHPDFQVPALPIHLGYRPTATTVLTWGMLGLGLVGLIFVTPDVAKRKTLVPVMLWLSGAVIAIPEVFVDIMGCVWYPISDETKAFTIMGRQMPWFIVTAWFGFAGPFMVVLYQQMRKGISAKQLWIAFIFSCIFTVPLEEFLLFFDQYYYYGNQPLILFLEHPFWWAPCNAGGIFLAAALVYRLEQMLQGWRSLSILFITPMAVGAFYGFIAMPSWIVVNGDYSWLVTQAAGILTLLMGVVGASLVIRFVVKGDVMPPPVTQQSTSNFESQPNQVA